MNQEEAEKTLDKWAEGILLPDAIIEFIKPDFGFVTVREILDDPQKFDGAICTHPIEGREYKANGKFYANSRVIYSFGHGGQTFKLRDTETWAEAPKSEAGQQDVYAAFLAELKAIPDERKSEIPDWVVSRLLRLRLSPALEDQILKEAGKRFGGKRAIVKMLKQARAEFKKAGNDSRKEGEISGEDFYAYMPMHQYIYIPTRELWPALSVNSRLGDDFNMWIDSERHVEQMTWAPGKNMVIENTVIADGGLDPQNGVSCFNLYRPPVTLHQATFLRLS